MDQLRGKVDGKVFEILTNEEVNDESLAMINDSDLINMGITQKGPRLIILSMIEKLKSRPSSSSAEDSFEKHEEMTRGWFEKDGRFRLKYLYPVLDQGMIPDRAGLSAITRIACRNLVSRIHQGEKYPDKSDMHRVAKDIVRLFPQLANTRITDASPEEIHQAFQRLYPSSGDGPTLQAELAKCLLVAPKRFPDVKDDCIRGALRVMSAMKTRGQRFETSTDVVLHEADPLIRWVEPTENDDAMQIYLNSLEDSRIQQHPHICCVASPMQSGPCYVVAGNSVLLNGSMDSSMALDNWFKCYPVFAIDVPVQLRMLWDFLACAVYKILPFSSRITVNNMVRSFAEVNTAASKNNMTYVCAPLP